MLAVGHVDSGSILVYCNSAQKQSDWNLTRTYRSMMRHPQMRMERPSQQHVLSEALSDRCLEWLPQATTWDLRLKMT